MYDPPALHDLVAAVREFLQEQAMPQLEGRTAFHARVAANALGIVERQLQLGPAAEAAELERLRGLLDQEGDLEALTRELCRRIRAGEIALDDEALLAHLRTTTLDKLAVDQPRYSGYQRALSARED